MALEMFDFIDEVLNNLEINFENLDDVSKELSEFFEEEVLEHSEGYININSRVKTPNSLKEKILRYSYYNVYKTPLEFFENLSDLIGIRIECRFIEDETSIYNMLTSYFTNIDEDGFYYNKSNKSIRLDLNEKQPQKQKNGFKIYKIDGRYEKDSKAINFELQIKSLVNIFWGEIEHRIIYKNYNYMLADNFLKDIMGSIKNNLAMIDHQLLIIYNQFNKSNTTNPVIRKSQSEALLSKIIYDIFSTRMKSSIGVAIDFKRPCDTIMSYIFRSDNIERMDEYGDTLVRAFSRLNDISRENIEFNSTIDFEREPKFNDEFSNIVGGFFLESINKE
ncbi:GTP pyrophosphokinase family protein, partial [Clostridium sp.]|uniref:GTP pyrophosphokinase family protein n=1 Tax=Clostridium sp. TaxID=1506 RepID=UPI0034642F93